jgi:proteasome lid subunit RPN8/RPN11
MKPETFVAFEAHAKACYPVECCGLIVRRAIDGQEEYRACRNVDRRPDVIDIHPRDWIDAEDQGVILAVCHSHPDASRMPSSCDVHCCEQSGLPWFILGSDGLHRLDPAAYREKLTERPWCFGWSDCWTLVRDYYGADMPDFPRAWGDVEPLFAAHLQDYGFEHVDAPGLQEGDLMLIQIKGHGANHAAVYVGGGEMLHHSVGTFSRREQVGPFLGAIRHVLRRTRCS